MIKPRLDDWWTRKKTTQIGYEGQECFGAGLSLDVLCRAFIDEPGVVWFSLITGDCEDDFCAIGVEKTLIPSPICEGHSGRGPLSEAAGRDVAEFVLSPRFLEFLDLESPVQAVDAAPKQNVRFGLHVHDDCFYRVRPIDSRRLDRLIGLALEVHSYYLGQEVNWSTVQQECVNFLLQKKVVVVMSDFRRQQLRLAQSTREPSIAGPVKAGLGEHTLTIRLEENRPFVVRHSMGRGRQLRNL